MDAHLGGEVNRRATGEKCDDAEQSEQAAAGIFFLHLRAEAALADPDVRRSNRGRRFFRMTPLHHHFELIGWSEPQVVIRFWLFGIAAAMVGVALALAV